MSGVGGRQRQADAQQKFLHTQLVFVGGGAPARRAISSLAVASSRRSTRTSDSRVLTAREGV